VGLNANLPAVVDWLLGLQCWPPTAGIVVATTQLADNNRQFPQLTTRDFVSEKIDTLRA